MLDLASVGDDKDHIFEFKVVAKPLQQLLILWQLYCLVVEVVFLADFEQASDNVLLQHVVSRLEQIHVVRDQ